jgi:hypothetical protein
MGKKLFLNVLYTIGIFVCLLLAYKGFAGKNYVYIVGGLFVGAVLVVFKIRLLKEVRDMQKKP